MTKEELAEEYKESKRHKCFKADVGKVQIDYESYLNNLKEAFLAGYETMEAYNEKLLNGDIEKHNKIVELQAQIEKMKCCEMCRHHKWGSCNYHSLWVNDCKENGMKLFELKEIKEK